MELVELHKIKVLVVDDSALMRKIISDIINEQDDLEVITTARNGEDLLEKLHKFTPDVITLDVEMPKMDGVTTLKELKGRKVSTPVIMLSSLTVNGSRLTMDCLRLGAYDFVAKPSGSISLDITKVGEDLIQKIRSTKSVNKKISTIKHKVEPVHIERVTSSKKRVEALLIGASTGGPRALYSVLPLLPKDLNVPVFVVQHMPKGFTKAFADRLNENSNMQVIEAEDGMIVEKNKIYIAKAGYHMEVGVDKRIHLNEEPTVWGVRPAVDNLLFSAVKVYGGNVVSVILTGMGRDGSKGTVAVKDAGGITISEHESTCTIYGMPKAAYDTGKVDMVLPLSQIKDSIIKIVSKN
jgi:two-component system chemotaxis response regulator CheB